MLTPKLTLLVLHVHYSCTMGDYRSYSQIHYQSSILPLSANSLISGCLQECVPTVTQLVWLLHIAFSTIIAQRKEVDYS